MLQEPSLMEVTTVNYYKTVLNVAIEMHRLMMDAWKSLGKPIST